MSHYKRVISLSLFLILLFTLGCGTFRKMEMTYYQFTYKSGQKIIASRDETVRKYKCWENAAIFLEDESFGPIEIKPGERILNRFVYASCHEAGIQGSIIRRIIHKGEKILDDKTPYEFMPGRWAVTAYIEIPSYAKPGAYIFEFEVKPKKENFKKTYSFQVLNPNKG